MRVYNFVVYIILYLFINYFDLNVYSLLILFFTSPLTGQFWMCSSPCVVHFFLFLASLSHVIPAWPTISSLHLLPGLLLSLLFSHGVRPKIFLVHLPSCLTRCPVTPLQFFDLISNVFHTCSLSNLYVSGFIFFFLSPKYYIPLLFVWFGVSLH